MQPLSRASTRLLAYHREIEARARQARLRHRRRRLQGRPPRPAAAARLRLARAALGARAQIPGREGDDGRSRHRDPGRPHRRADAGRAARAGDRRRRRRPERDAAQRGLHQGHRRQRRADPRRRRHPRRRHGRSCSAPATSSRRSSTSMLDKRPPGAKPYVVSDRLPGLRQPRGARGQSAHRASEDRCAAAPAG